jgi:hypothetical protein
MPGEKLFLHRPGLIKLPPILFDERIEGGWNMSSIEYLRIYSDPEGISHFETKSIELEFEAGDGERPFR